VGHRGTRGAWRRHGSERGRRVRRRRLDERPVGFHLRAARTTRTAVQRRNRLDEHGLQGPPGPGLRRAPEELAGAVGIGALMGRRTAIVTMRPCRTPHHTIADVGLIGGARCPCRARSRWHIMAGSFSMNCRSSADMSWRCCGNRWRRGRIQTISRTSSICERWKALRYERSMFPAKGDEGPSESCPLMEDRYRSKSVGQGSTAAALFISSVRPR
jgi:hypothetical protein